MTRLRPGVLAGVAAAVVVVSLGLPLRAGAGPAPASAPASVSGPSSTAAPATQADASTITLLSQPASVSADGSFRVFVSIAHAPAGGDLRVDIYDRLESPDQLDALGQAGPTATFDRVPLADDPPSAPELAGFSIELYHHGGRHRPDTTWAYPLQEAGVYPVRVLVRDRDGATLATLFTTMIRLPSAEETVPKAKVAVVATVTQSTPRPARARLATDRVSRGLRRGIGVLTQALAAHPLLPATLHVTPDTALRLRGDPSTRDTLAALKLELARSGRTLLDAPYVDLDPAALVGNGLDDELTRQRDLGRATLTSTLGAPDPDTSAIGGRVDALTLTALRDRGTYHVLLPAEAFTGAAPVLPVDLGAGDGVVRAVAVEPAFTVPPSTDPDAILDTHRLLARVAITSEANPGGADIVVSMDARSTDPAALTLLFDALSFGTPFFGAAGLGQVMDDSAPASASAPTLAPVSAANLGAYPDASREAHASLDSYASMVSDRPHLVHRFDRPLALAAAADLPVPDRIAALQAVDVTLQHRFAAISTPASDQVTLGARDARFPLLISSKLPYPTDVLVELSANDRLQFPRQRIKVTLTGARTLTQIRVRTRASGDTPVLITVRSPDGRVILSESRYTIRSTAVSGVGVLITIGAAGFLALWWARHWFRSRRSRGVRSGPAEPVTPADPAAV